MSNSKTTTPGDRSVPSQVSALQCVLDSQLREYRALLACMNEKGEAIRHAQMDRVASVFEREKGIIQRISDSERARMDVTHSLTKALSPQAQKPLRVKQIAEAIQDEELQARLLATAEQLRSAATEAKERSTRLRAAAEALARHMSGVMQTVRSALSRAGVYEQKGQLAVGAQLNFSVDVRS